MSYLTKLQLVTIFQYFNEMLYLLYLHYITTTRKYLLLTSSIMSIPIHDRSYFD